MPKVERGRKRSTEIILSRKEIKSGRGRERKSYCPRQCCCLQARRRTVVRGLPPKEKEVIELSWRHKPHFPYNWVGWWDTDQSWGGAVVKSQAGLPSHLLLVGQHRIQAALSTQKEGGVFEATARECETSLWRTSMWKDQSRDEGGEVLRGQLGGHWGLKNHNREDRTR